MSNRGSIALRQSNLVEFSQDVQVLRNVLSSWGYLSPNVHISPLHEITLPTDITEAINVFRRQWNLSTDLDLNTIVSMFNRRKCSVPDKLQTEIHVQAYGAPGGYWTRGNLTYRINYANSGMSQIDVNNAITRAFQLWQRACPYFNFTGINSDADIEIRFGGNELDNSFGSAGGVVGAGGYPNTPWQGSLNFDSSEAWTINSLFCVALHEIGHVLGLSHSTSQSSVMYPYDMHLMNVDIETISAIRNLYQWQPQIRIDGRGTSNGPSIAVGGSVGFGSSNLELYMAWKGIEGDSGLYWSHFNGNFWSPQQKIANVGSSHGPALISAARGRFPSVGLFMAWKGAQNDNGIYFSESSNLVDWSPQRKVGGVGTSCKPALLEFNNRIYMAWKGIEDDSGIYYSSFDGSSWLPQQKIRGVGTSSSPTLTSFNNRLYMFWKGIDDDSRIYYSWIENHGAAIWQAQHVVSYTDIEIDGAVLIDVGTSHGPTAILHGNSIVMAWKGILNDSGIWFAPFNNDEWSGQIKVFGVGTSNSPSLEVFNNRLYMAWKGIQGDSSIYFSWLG